MELNYLSYDASIIKPIRAIDFDILSNDEVRRMSALAGTHGVEFAELYDKQSAKAGGLIDERMGGSGTNLCATCQLDGKYCDGHPAHIDLAEPVFNILFYQYLRNILECICINCSTVLIQKDEDKIRSILDIPSKRNRFVKVHEMAGKTKTCLNCGMKASKIRVEIKKATSAINMYSETELIDGDDKSVRKHRVVLTPDIISGILDNMSDEDCNMLGIDPDRSRPANMIHKVFHVPPIHVRPSLRGFFSGGSTMEDGLTHKLADIIKSNTRIFKQKETNNENTNKYSKDHAHLLQYHVATYYDPDIISVPKADGKGSQFKPLCYRYKGKTGRIRGNLMGKRGNFNARTVITSDPTIATNYLGVPVKIAMTITFPEFVTPENFDRLSKLVRNGTDVYPGANYVYRGANSNNVSNKPIYLKLRKETVVLKYGDIVERHLQNHDIVLLNRQPTLHKQSMMAHRVQVIDNDDFLTFRMAVSVTGPYGADFDGDEMNIFCPQSIQTQIELEEIADVKKQLISSAKSVTIYGIVQDGLIGAYNLTDPRVRINWRDAMNIMSYTTFDDFSKIKKNREYTGAELFSMIIPPKVTLKVGNIDIKDGELVSGKINNSIIGAKKKNNLLHYIWDQYGEDKTREFIDDCQYLAHNFNLLNGFTVGIGDAQVPPQTKKDISKYIEGVMNKVDIDITNIENNPSYMSIANFERKIHSDTNVVRDDVSKIATGSVSPDNNFNVMINSGSKGGSNNLGQMAGCVGLQDFEGGLMPKMYNDRTLCYFHENDDRAKSRGLCYNSYMNGLSYSEFCYHTKAGRNGLITQVVKTAETGYAQRKLIKTMEDVMIKYDGTVRISNNQIIQQIYGGNGNNTIMQYEYQIKMIEMNNKILEENFKFTDNELSKYSDFTKKDNDNFYSMIKEMRDTLRANSIKSKLNYMTVSNGYMIPVNINRIIASMKLSGKSSDKLTPSYIINAINNLLTIESTPLIKVSAKDIKNPSKYTTMDEQVAKYSFKAALFDALNPKTIIDKLKMNRQDFDELMQTIKTQYNDNIVEPGEMVGILAAESLGEAVTQMTISAFHHTGIASLTHSTSGVPRINELISATKKPKTPQMFVYLNDDSRNSREIAHNIGAQLEKTTFGDIYKKIEVYYDPSPMGVDGFMKQDGIIHDPFYSRKLSKTNCQADVENLPWLFRIQIDKEKMLDKEVTLMDIKSEFCMWWERRYIAAKKRKEKTSLFKKITSFAMLSNTDNDTQPMIHIRFNVKNYADNDSKKKEISQFSRKTLIEFADFIEKFKLKGVDGVERINTIAKERTVSAMDGDGMKIGDEQVIYTSGVNLKDIRYIKGINPYRTFTDDIASIYKTFGIEFARNRLLGEFLKAYENAGNSGINPQHISLLVDIMCYGGSVISADRHGMKKADIDPLTKASFEKSIDVLLSSAVFGDTDKMRGVSSRLYIGSVFKGGTGYCELVLDTDKILNSEYVDQDNKVVKTSLNMNTLATAIMEEANEDDDIFIPE